MKRAGAIRAATVVALLVPGIVMGLPVPGPCELCGEGNDCHMHSTVQPPAEAHSCCGAESETPPEPSLGTSNCECGREAPPALTAETLTTIDTAVSLAVTEEDVNPAVAAGAVTTLSKRQAMPPPTPPAYLIGCEFLT